MIQLNVKPLSVNQAWQGKKYKTPQYVKYEKILLALLPQISIPQIPLKLNIQYHFSSKLADIDNPTKPLLDILQKKYKINDKDIHQLNLSKYITQKGKEKIIIEITHIEKY